MASSSKEGLCFAEIFVWCVAEAYQRSTSLLYFILILYSCVFKSDILHSVLESDVISNILGLMIYPS